MVPVQDLLEIGKEGRMNLPSTLSTDNWSYKVNKEIFDRHKPELEKMLVQLNDKYKRY